MLIKDARMFPLTCSLILSLAMTLIPLITCVHTMPMRRDDMKDTDTGMER